MSVLSRLEWTRVRHQKSDFLKGREGEFKRVIEWLSIHTGAVLYVYMSGYIYVCMYVHKPRRMKVECVDWWSSFISL